MYDYSQYNRPQYEQNYASEPELELHPDFEMEDYENNYGYETESSYEAGPDYEYNPNYEYNNAYETEPSYELEGESAYNYETDQEWGPEGEYGNDYETGSDYESQNYEGYPDREQQDLESGLDYVSNEQELEDWVNEIAVRDHRTRNIVNTPVGRKAVRQLTNIAARTLPRIGSAVGWRGQPRYRTWNRPTSRQSYWQRPYRSQTGQNRWWYNGRWYNRPRYYGQQQNLQRGYRPWGNQSRYRPWWDGRRWRYPYYGYGSSLSVQTQDMQPQDTQPQGISTQGFQQPSFSQQSFQPQVSQPQDFSQDAGQGSAPAPSGQPDISSFIQLVLDTLRNLARQVAQQSPAGSNVANDIEQIRTALIPAAATNFPSIIQSKQGPPPGPDSGSGSQQSPPTSGGNGGSVPNQAPGGQPSGTEKEVPFYGEIMDTEESFNEVTEMELASELLSLNSEQELDYFLDDLFKTAVGAVSSLVGSPIGNKLKGMLKGAAKKVLPSLGTAAGTFFGGPVGGAIGGTIAKGLSSLFGLELEGLSPEDKDFEMAKAFVRLAGNAAKQGDEHDTGNPTEDARRAFIEAAKRFAPGMLVRKSGGSNGAYGRQQSYRNNGNYDNY
jgi:hypothetical protein